MCVCAFYVISLSQRGIFSVEIQSAVLEKASCNRYALPIQTIFPHWWNFDKMLEGQWVFSLPWILQRACTCDVQRLAAGTGSIPWCAARNFFFSSFFFFFPSQNRLSVPTRFLTVSVHSRVQSHALTSVRTLKIIIITI